jgi:hypothetical protein
VRRVGVSQIMKSQAGQLGSRKETVPRMGQRLRLNRLPIFAGTDERVVTEP